MTDITKLAKGRECQIRVPLQCLSSTETVVLCHLREIGVSGMGLKAPDWLGAFGCQRCHDIVDGRAGSWIEFPQWYRDTLLYEAMVRTLVILVSEGVIQVPEPTQRKPKRLSKILPRRNITEAQESLGK